MTAQRSVSPASPSASPAWSRSTTSRSTSRPDRATRSAARTAPARARSSQILAGIQAPDEGELSARWATGPLQAAGGCARRRRRDGAAGTSLLRQPVGGREPLPRIASIEPGMAGARGIARTGAPAARVDRRGDRSGPPDRDAEHRAAADGADRGGRRQRRPGDHLRRTDQLAWANARSSSCTP